MAMFDQLSSETDVDEGRIMHGGNTPLGLAANDESRVLPAVRFVVSDPS